MLSKSYTYFHTNLPTRLKWSRWSDSHVDRLPPGMNRPADALTRTEAEGQMKEKIVYKNKSTQGLQF
jgi:hypothetical protein